MQRDTTTFPKDAKIPSDYIFLLTYTAGNFQTPAQRTRTNETTAKQNGWDIDSATQIDELN